MFSDVLGRFETCCDVSGRYGGVLKHLGGFWLFWGCFGTFWDIWGHSGTFEDVFGHFGRFWVILAHFGDVLRCFRIFFFMFMTICTVLWRFLTIWKFWGFWDILWYFVGVFGRFGTNWNLLGSLGMVVFISSKKNSLKKCHLNCFYCWAWSKS